MHLHVLYGFLGDSFRLARSKTSLTFKAMLLHLHTMWLILRGCLSELVSISFRHFTKVNILYRERGSDQMKAGGFAVAPSITLGEVPLSNVML